MTLAASYPTRTLARNWYQIWGQLSPAERAVLPYIWQLWLRADQWIELGLPVKLGGWRWHGLIAGRGFGKSRAMAAFVNRLVALGHGRIGNGFALCAHNEAAVHDIQIRALVETALPWDVPRVIKKRVEWPSGAHALIFTAESPEACRGANLELAWCTELVAWPRSYARQFWEDLAFATRVGLEKMVFDTTSKGRQPVILDRVAEAAAQPNLYRLRYGTSYDNPLLGAGFWADVEQRYPNKDSRRFQEEILGKVFTEAGQALWQAEWIEAGRREVAPSNPEIVLLALDPSRSKHEGSDEFGLVIASRARDGEIYVLEDHSGRFDWSHAIKIVLDRCALDAAGIVWESNNAASTAVINLLEVEARAKGMVLHTLPRGAPFPRRQAGRIYVREAHTDKSKEARADAPSSLYARGKVHHVGNLSQLEEELTTWEPGEGKSPNRLDALCYVVAELGGVGVDAPTNVRAEAAQAARAQEILRGGAGAQGALEAGGYGAAGLSIRDPRGGRGGRGGTI